MSPYVIWIIATALLLVLEVLTQMMWALCLAGGAVAALICSLLDYDVEWQLSVMGITSAVICVLTSLSAYRPSEEDIEMVESEEESPHPTSPTRS